MPCLHFETSYHLQAMESPGVPAPAYPLAGKPFMEQWPQTCSRALWTHACSVGRVRPCQGVYTPSGHQPGLPLPSSRILSWPAPVSHPHHWQGSQKSCFPSLFPTSLPGAAVAVQGVVLDFSLCAPWTHV